MMVGRALTGSDVRPEFAVVDQVDAGVPLARDHVGDRCPQPAQVLLLVAEVPGGALLVESDQVFGPLQAARVAVHGTGLRRLASPLPLQGIDPGRHRDGDKRKGFTETGSSAARWPARSRPATG